MRRKQLSEEKLGDRMLHCEIHSTALTDGPEFSDYHPPVNSTVGCARRGAGEPPPRRISPRTSNAMTLKKLE
jgi:hypothetical protein